jgi:Glycosyl transferase family 8
VTRVDRQEWTPYATHGIAGSCDPQAGGVLQHFFDWAAEQIDRERPWLILGKGPSFQLRSRYDLSQYDLMSLNHAVREQPVRLAHMIDFDVAEACGEVLHGNAGFVVLPWFPHVRNRPGARSLEELLPESTILRRLETEGRLLWYDLSTAARRHGPGPVVRATYFSSEAALSLLAQAGVARVRSLGVDGGASYSSEFDDLTQSTLLANGRPDFNLQFQGFARTIMSTGVDYAPLNLEAPVRIYVGSQDAQMLAVKVLEYSIRKHASLTVEVFPLHLANIEFPMPRDVKNRPRTPFSFQRFYIPELAGFHGRAIYVDSDMQVFQDIRSLWTIPFEDADLLAAREAGDAGRKPQFSVMLLNCDELRWNLVDIVAALDRGDLTYETLMYEMAVARKVRAGIDARWNSLETYREGETALLHYTDMHLQPWISRENKHGYLWIRDLIEAVDRGAISRAEVESHVAQGYVRPTVLYQLDHRVEEAALLPAKARELDRGYVAPYQKMGAHGGASRSNPLRAIRAILRHVYQKSLLHRIERRIRKGDAYPIRSGAAGE